MLDQADGALCSRSVWCWRSLWSWSNVGVDGLYNYNQRLTKINVHQEGCEHGREKAWTIDPEKVIGGGVGSSVHSNILLWSRLINGNHNVNFSAVTVSTHDVKIIWDPREWHFWIIGIWAQKCAPKFDNENFSKSSSGWLQPVFHFGPGNGERQLKKHPVLKFCAKNVAE